MTAALYDEVVTVAPARTLTVVRDDRQATSGPRAKKVTRRADTQPFASAATRWWTALRAC